MKFAVASVSFFDFLTPATELLGAFCFTFFKRQIHESCKNASFEIYFLFPPFFSFFLSLSLSLLYLSFFLFLYNAFLIITVITCHSPNSRPTIKYTFSHVSALANALLTSTQSTLKLFWCAIKCSISTLISFTVDEYTSVLSLLVAGNHPDLDESKHLDDEEHTKYLNWIVTIGRIDIVFAVSSLSRSIAFPRQGHMDRALYDFGYL